MEILAQIKAPHFTAGIVLTDDVVTEAAPIVRYMKGWHRGYVRHYVTQKRWQIAVVKPGRVPETAADTSSRPQAPSAALPSERPIPLAADRSAPSNRYQQGRHELPEERDRPA